VALVVVTFIVAIIFHPLRIRFNKLTNSLFFRDYYEPQEILDQLSTVLVGSVEVKHIENSSTKILINTFRPQFLKFLFMSEPESNQGNQEIIKIMKSFKDNVLFVDEIKSDHNRVIYGSSYDKPIAVAIRLSTSNQDLGYLLLGYKESGNIYNNVDKRLLGIAADEIAISLQNALRFKEIQQFNITLQAKVDEATKELKKTNEKLKALDETKDDFISMASHQLRTPLAIIKGYVNMLVHGDAGKLNKQQKDFLDQASISSETMVRLVTSLLNVSRITSGKFSVESNPVNLADIVENEVLQLSNMAKERNIQLTYQKPNDFPILMLDEEKIRQVVANFIDNAIHYSKDKGAKINVQLTDNDDIIFEVIDNGIGVPPNEKEHLFTKFYRAKNAKEARPNGTGVGIYLAKVVINELGGDLVFESKEGIGSTFGFRFKKDKIVQPVSKS
jgi:signal transduction histidine kinase